MLARESSTAPVHFGGPAGIHRVPPGACARAMPRLPRPGPHTRPARGGSSVHSLLPALVSGLFLGYGLYVLSSRGFTRTDQIDPGSFERCSALKCVQEALESYPFHPSEKPRVRWTCDADFDFVGSQDLMAYVLFNLLKNALFAIRAQGRGDIHIRIGLKDAPRTVLVKDTGSGSGNVDLRAGQRYTQTGSDVLAPGGDITVAAQQIDITEARETQRSEVVQRFKQSGLSVSLSAPAVQTAQTMVSTAQAVGQTRSDRMKALGAATLVMQGQELADQAGKTVEALQNGQGIAEASGLTLSVSLGSSRSEAHQNSQSDTARGSQVLASGNVTLQASGAASDSDLLVRGSRVEAGQTARLQAQGDITLEAAANTYRDSSSHSSKGTSVGMSFSAQGISANASISRASGQGNGEGTAYSNTQVGGREVVVESGGDTTLQGAVVSGGQVSAQVGGDLRIHSLQDTDQYHEASRSMGVGVRTKPADGMRAASTASLCIPVSVL